MIPYIMERNRKQKKISIQSSKLQYLTENMRSYKIARTSSIAKNPHPSGLIQFLKGFISWSKDCVVSWFWEHLNKVVGFQRADESFEMKICGKNLSNCVWSWNNNFVHNMDYAISCMIVSGNWQNYELWKWKCYENGIPVMIENVLT